MRLSGYCRKLKAAGLLNIEEYQPLEDEDDDDSSNDEDDDEGPTLEEAVRDIKSLERSCNYSAFV